MNRIEIVKELLGEGTTEFVADSLRETYKDIKNELQSAKDGSQGAPVYSHNEDEEIEELTKMLNAVELVYSWYGIGSIDE